MLAVGQLAGVAFGPDVEAQDHRVGRARQVDVVLGDGTDAAANDAQRHLLADVDLEQRVLDGLDRPGHVTLEDEVELGLLPLLEPLEQRLEGGAAPACREGGIALPGLPLLGDLAGHAVLGDDQEVVPGPGDTGEAQHLDRLGGPSLGDVLAALVEHGADAAEGVAGDDRVTNAQGAALDQDGRDRAAALVQAGLDGDALGGDVRVSRELERRIGGQQDRVQELLEVEPVTGRDVDEHRVAAKLLRHQAVLGELAAHLHRVRALLVDLVDCDDDRDVGRLSVVERLDGLRLHPVVSSHDQHRDVGDLGPAGTHGREGLVTGGVDEGDLADAALDGVVHLVRADVLRDTARLALDDVRTADGVQQAGLAVVDVPHDRDDRRPGEQLGLVVVVAAESEAEAVEQLGVLLLGGDDLHLVAQLGAEQLQRLVGAGLRRGDHLAELGEDHLHERAGVGVDAVGEVREGRAAR